MSDPLDLFSTAPKSVPESKSSHSRHSSTDTDSEEERRARRAKREKRRERRKQESSDEEETRRKDRSERNERIDRSEKQKLQEDDEPKSKKAIALAKADQVISRVQPPPPSKRPPQQYNNPHLTGPPPPSVPYATFEAVKNELHDKCILLSVAGASIAKQTQLITSLKTECEEHKQQRIHAETQLNIIEHERKQLQKVIEYQRTQLTDQAKQLQLRVLPRHMAEHAQENRQYAAQIQNLNSNSASSTAAATGGQPQSMEEEVKQLRLVTHHFKQVINDHEATIARLKRDNDQLNALVAKHKKDLQQLSNYSNQLKENANEIHNLRQTIKQLEEVKTDLEDQLQDIQDDYKERKAKWKREKKELLSQIEGGPTGEKSERTKKKGATNLPSDSNDLTDILSTLTPKNTESKTNESHKKRTELTNSPPDGFTKSKSTAQSNNALFDMDLFSTTDLDKFNSQSAQLNEAIAQSLEKSSDENARRLSKGARSPIKQVNRKDSELENKSSATKKEDKSNVLDDLVPDFMNTKL